jgi:hypothetical protein
VTLFIAISSISLQPHQWLSVSYWACRQEPADPGLSLHKLTRTAASFDAVHQDGSVAALLATHAAMPAVQCFIAISIWPAKPNREICCASLENRVG